jgi:Phosphotransferase enzyme family
LHALDTSLGDATDVARSLAGDGAEISRLTTGGRNSRIWRVHDGERTFALKQYPSRLDDPRDRLAVEVGALQLMEHCLIEEVPRVLGVDTERGYALLSWIEGGDVTEVGDADIDAAVTFLSAIHKLRATSWASGQPLAAEACLCGYEIERQIEGRLSELRTATAGDAQAIEFLHFFAGHLSRSSGLARRQIAGAGLDFGSEVPQEWRSLVPSDFGFHNSLRRSDGSLAFVDFEYFGWDDPVKLTADVLLHPGRPLFPAQRKRFRQAATKLYGADPAFPVRLQAYLPLFGLRWVLILLNEFIPERWRRRVLAGDSSSWGDAKARQLSRAREFLADLPNKLEE